MPWHVNINNDFPIIETCYSGFLTRIELSDAIQQTLKIAKDKGINLLLSDCSTLKGGHDVFDLYELVNVIMKMDLHHTLTLMEAIILPDYKESEELVKFWETTCSNRGITVRLFNDRQSALDWLLEHL
jgi:hypothetical protein